MKSLINLAYFFIITHICLGQNLVVNPSFETNSSCPNGYSQISLADGWKPAASSPDLLNLCGFFDIEYNTSVLPTDGDAMASLLTFFPNVLDDTTVRESMHGTLVQQLDTSWYFVSLDVLPDPDNRTNALSVYFSKNDLGVISTYPTYLKPQINIAPDWVGGMDNWSNHCRCANELG
jgi:hypothetical protein